MAPEPQDPPEAPGEPQGTAERLDRVEATLDRFGTILESLRDGAHGQAADATAARLDRPSSVEEQAAAAVRQALAAKDAEDQQAELHRGVAEVRAEVAALKEAPPEPPARRIEKFMGWAR